MKKIHSYILAVAALLAFVPGMRAQTIEEVIGALEFPADTSGFSETANIGFKKNISKPLDGTYWLKLEAYATGSGTETSKAKPSDVILVLDLSSSMSGAYPGYTSRLAGLQDATKKFVDSIYQNAVDALAKDPNYPGNRIAIITYSGSTQVVLESGGWVSVDETGRDDLKTAINGFSLEGHSGTRPEYGLKMAIDELLSGTTDNDSARDGAHLSVVMFTDGYPVQSQTDPGEGNGNTRFNYGYANDAIYYAHQIKSDYKATMYTVGLITEVAQANSWEYRNYRRVQYLMDLLSSNYPDSNMDELGNTSTWTVAGNSLGAITVNGLTPGDKDPQGDYFQLVTEDTDLSKIFDTIASQTGGSPAETFTEESEAVDIVSSSFVFDGASAGDIKVFTAPYLFDSATKTLYFGTETLAPNSTDTYDDYEVVDGNKVLVKADKDVDDAIMEAGGITVNGSEITVTGFDYADNWCGPVKTAAGDTTDAMGHKIIIMIPIVTNPDAVGGPNVATNGPGSGIKDKNGDMLVKFDPPAVSLPINVQIKTTGLKEGESAKYSVKRRVGEGEWEYVTTVFVTRHKGQGDPAVYLKGLPSRGAEGNYQYIIIDDDWDWTYTLDNVSGTRTDGETDPYGPDEDIYTDNFAVNPIIFNVSKNDGISPKVRYSESKATNNFKTQEAGYDDYKNNGRTVITYTQSE